MTRKRRRLTIVLLGMLALGGATALVLAAFEDNLVFFYSPTDIATKPVPKDRRLRVGGIVVDGSLQRERDGVTVAFVLTDLATTLPVRYKGVLPDLFREGQGIVAQGRLGTDGTFAADEVLAKHDENYMPPEVANALRKSGQWKGEGAR
ncbi:MAG: cytochrome c maturation protein CcmE [Alphaproteobacteria bacterium]|nr:cytochrome c maturation protein CcmE [Alphaproteobacteria bacterium]